MGYKCSSWIMLCVFSLSCTPSWSKSTTISNNPSTTQPMDAQSSPIDGDMDGEQFDAPNEVPIEYIQHFVEVFQMVKENYVNDVTNQQLFNNAMQGLVEHLDPYSHYLTAQRYQQLLKFTEGQVAQPNFNLKLDTEKKQWIITDLFEKSESYKLGLRDQMQIERIDGTKLQNLDERNVKALFVGMLGSSLKLAVRTGDKIRIIEVIRDQKQNYAVESHMTDDRILVIRIKAFQQDTTAQVKSILETIQPRIGIKGILIDIRDNPGGLLSAAVDLAGLFLEKGLIVSTKSRSEAPQQFRAFHSQKPILEPMAILQNRYSASAAEVFSAAMKENKRAIVLGETSYGKGAIQKLFPLAQGDALQLTVAHYYTPTGQLIDGKGIEANLVLDMDNIQSDKQIQSVAAGVFIQYLKQPNR